MIKTSEFRTKTILIKRMHESLGNVWGSALDIGYSSVKGFSPNSAYCFPSYARKIDSPKINLGENDVSDIIYKDNSTGETWCVGASAQNMITSDETNDSNTALYGRNRYFSPMFKVIARTGLGLGMMDNKYGSPDGKTLLLQTGLPPAYLKGDTVLLKEALSGTHDFSLKVGNNPWKRFQIELPEENIRVMAQPMGTLLSISTDNRGRLIEDAAKYFKSNVLIFDPGFGTLDVFDIKNRFISDHQTRDDLGMKQVLTETTNEIYAKYGVDIPVSAMQKNLEKGTFTKFDRKLMETRNIPFADILNKANENVCKKAIAAISDTYYDLRDHQYLVITGGTGAAWTRIIKDHFSRMQTLEIVSGNQNDSLPMIFSNVRGYYMYQLNKIRTINKSRL